MFDAGLEVGSCLLLCCWGMRSTQLVSCQCVWQASTMSASLRVDMAIIRLLIKHAGCMYGSLVAAICLVGFYWVIQGTAHTATGLACHT